MSETFKCKPLPAALVRVELATGVVLAADVAGVSGSSMSKPIIAKMDTEVTMDTMDAAVATVLQPNSN
jgi:hypothetical protein